MATIEEIKNELNKAEARLDEAVKELKEWEKGKYKGEKLNELEEELMVGNFNEAERKKREERRDRLLEEKKRLERNVDDWKNQVNFPLDDFSVSHFFGGNESWIKFAVGISVVVLR